MDEDERSEIAAALNNIAGALHKLGNADADTSMGGLEALGNVINEGLEGVSCALDSIAQAIKLRG